MTLSEYLSALEALSGAAAEGPWKAKRNHPSEKGHHIDAFVNVLLAKVYPTNAGPDPFTYIPADTVESDANAAFIAASRAALPFLCKIMRAQAEVIEAQKDAVQQFVDNLKKGGVWLSKFDIHDHSVERAESTLATLIEELKV